MTRIKKEKIDSNFVNEELELPKTKEEKLLEEKKDTELGKTSKNKKRKNKLFLKKLYSKPPVILASIVILALAIVLIFKTDIFVNGFKKLLNSLGIYTEVIKNVEITSNDFSDLGSWHIDKSAKWTGPGKAQITFDLNTIRKSGQIKNNYDVVLVLDVSTSMKGEKIDSLKSSAKKYIDEVLQDADNNVAIVEYHTFATVLSEFTKDKENLSNIIDNLELKCKSEVIDGVKQNYGYCTNYYDGLAKTEELLSNYKEQDGRQLVVLLLTDGAANRDNDLISSQYKILKSKYPHMVINGIQYEMGKDINYYLIKASDYQYDAYADNIYDVFFEATYKDELLAYENFTINDYIENEYFYVNSVDNIYATRGTVNLEEENGVQKVVWNLGNGFLTGASAKMYINVNLKEEYLSKSDFITTNKKESIDYKIINEEQKEVKSNKTPVLKHSYEVFYDTNTPEGCKLDDIPKESHYVYENVAKKSEQLTCDGYLFRGWEITDADSDDIKIINDDSFIMPEHDVTIRATWSKQTIAKSMDGTVHEKVTLYKVLQNEAEAGGLAKEYEGEHQDSINGVGSEKIYHYYAETDEEGEAILDKNNVIFAGQCWQMIRTTDTGGVKMIYNGEPDATGKCGTNRSNHVGWTGYASTYNLSNDALYYYGTSYTYDNSTKKFKVSGDVTLSAWSETNGPNLVGKYACFWNREENECSSLYYILSYKNSTTANVISIGTSSAYSQFGYIKYTDNSESLASLGYMSNKVYNSQSRNFSKGTESVLNSSTLYNTYWFASSVEWGTSTANKWSLVDPFKVTSESEYQDLVGKYTFGNTNQTYTNATARYIASIEEGKYSYSYLYIPLTSGEDVNYFNYMYTYGDSVTDNEDGTYKINNATTIERKNWYENYENFQNKYVCKNATNDSCSEVWYVTSSNKGSFNYIKLLDMYSFANEFTYENGVYRLKNKSDIYDVNKVNFDKAHYTCFNTTGECTTLSYIYLASDMTSVSYINLEDGKSVEDALEEILSDDDVNMTDSLIKKTVDLWYEKYMLDYTSYLENDTIFCNDRSISNLGGWDPNGSIIKPSIGINYDLYLQFKNYKQTNDLRCQNVTDRFSAENEKAKLNYPVGLMTRPEMELLNNSKARKTAANYWLASPSDFINGLNNTVVYSTGVINYNGMTGSAGIRPAIALKAGTEFIDGDGSMDNPYYVE